MHQELAHIVSVGIYEPMPGFFRLQLAAPTLVAGMKPGQFLLVNTDTEYVRQPLFPIALNSDGLCLLLPQHSPLRLLGPDDELDCIGPLGRGFRLAAPTNNLLLLAQSTGFGANDGQNGVSFLLTLIDQALEAGNNVLLVHEAPTATQLFPPAGLPPNVEVRLATLDGSRGHAGTALDLLPRLAQWADQVCAVGHPEWYRDLVSVLREHRIHLSKEWAWGLIAPEVMPCGMGVCGGCALDTKRGYRLACTDGPVFDLTEI
jgi:dihydroorotate dehydrogenase electron transfer subunit